MARWGRHLRWVADEPGDQLAGCPLELRLLAGRSPLRLRAHTHQFVQGRHRRIPHVAPPAKSIFSSPVGVHGFVFIVATDEPYTKMRYLVPALKK